MVVPGVGVALRQEWVADWAETFCVTNEFDALLLSATESAGNEANEVWEFKDDEPPSGP